MNKNFSKKLSLITLLSLISLFSLPHMLLAQKKQTIAILPFELISPDELSYIQAGTLQMLHSRLRWKDHIETIDKNQINTYLSGIEQKDYNFTIKKIADLTNCDFVLTGSITQFANAFSIDTRIYDIKNKKYLTFFEQSKIIDDVVPKINVIAAKINKKVFQRESLIYENLIKKEKEKAEQWKRQNPEKLMPVFPQGEQKEKSSIWKFWEYL